MEKCQTSIYKVLEEHGKKLDQLNEQVTIMRIEMAVHREKINEDRRFHSSIWGVIGGTVSAAVVAVIDFLFRK